VAVRDDPDFTHNMERLLAALERALAARLSPRTDFGSGRRGTAPPTEPVAVAPLGVPAPAPYASFTTAEVRSATSRPATPPVVAAPPRPAAGSRRRHLAPAGGGHVGHTVHQAWARRALRSQGCGHTHSDHRRHHACARCHRREAARRLTSSGTVACGGEG